MSEGNTSDLFAAWRKALDSQIEAWWKLMAESMGTEAFAAALGRQMEAYLSTHGQLQKRFMEVMEHYLKSLNLPSRNDLARVAAQLSAVEAKVDELDTRADEVIAQIQAVQRSIEAIHAHLEADEQARTAALRDVHSALAALEERLAQQGEHQAHRPTAPPAGEQPQRPRGRGRRGGAPEPAEQPGEG